MESRKRLTAEKRGRGTGKGAIPAVSVLAAAFGAGVQLAVFGRIGQSGGVFYTSPCLVYMGIYVLTAFCLPRAAAAAVSGRVRRGQADPGALLAGSLALAAVAGGAGAALLGFGGEMLAAWSGRPMERYAWEALAPAVWLMALLGALRGHFLGLGGSAPAAVSMILEQAAGGAAALWFAGDGLREGSRSVLVYGAEELEGALGASGAMAGPAVGAGAGLLFLLGMTVLWRKNLLRRTSGRKASPARQVMPLLLAGIPGLFMAAAWASALALQIKWYGTASGNRWGEFGFWCLAADLLAAVSAAVGVPAASRLSGRRPGAREGLVRALRRLPVPCILGAVLLAAGGRMAFGRLFDGAQASGPVWLGAVWGCAVPAASLGAVLTAALGGFGKRGISAAACLLCAALHGGLLRLFAAAWPGAPAGAAAAVLLALLALCGLEGGLLALMTAGGERRTG